MLEFLVGIIAGYLILKAIGDMLMFALFKQHIKDDVQIIEEMEIPAMDLYIENHDDGYIRMYEEHNDAFVCQGKTMQEISERFLERYPNLLGIIRKETGHQIIIAPEKFEITIE